MPRIGLYGGSFDPVHLGHLMVAHAALEEARLDKLIFIPAALSPFKPSQTPAPAAARVAMLRGSLAGLAWAEVDLQEIERGGTSYTIDTVMDWRRQAPDAELFYIIGADHVPSLGKWRASARLASEVTFLVVPRPGEKLPEIPEGFCLQPLVGHPVSISSSDIRRRIQEGRSVGQLLPSFAAQFVVAHQLYSEERGRHA